MSQIDYALAKFRARRECDRRGIEICEVPTRTSQCAWRNRGIFKRPTLLVEWQQDIFAMDLPERGLNCFVRRTWWARARPEDFAMIIGKPGS